VNSWQRQVPDERCAVRLEHVMSQRQVLPVDLDCAPREAVIHAAECTSPIYKRTFAVLSARWLARSNPCAIRPAILSNADLFIHSAACTVRYFAACRESSPF